MQQQMQQAKFLVRPWQWWLFFDWYESCTNPE